MMTVHYFEEVHIQEQDQFITTGWNVGSELIQEDTTWQSETINKTISLSDLAYSLQMSPGIWGK
jgi:hypothetical protein